MRILTILNMLLGISEIASGQAAPSCDPNTDVCNFFATLNIENNCRTEVVVSSDALDFGVLNKPESGVSGWMELDPESGNRYRSRITYGSETYQFGKFSVKGPGCRRCFIRRARPTRTLEHEDGPETIEFAGKVAYSDDDINWESTSIYGFGWISPPGSDQRLRHIRVGGIISGITSDTRSGTYTGKIFFNVLCATI